MIIIVLLLQSPAGLSSCLDAMLKGLDIVVPEALFDGIVNMMPFCLSHLSPALLLRKSVICPFSSPLCLLKELLDLPVDPL